VGSKAKPDFAEVYYTMSGNGDVTLGTETSTIHAGDVMPVQLNETREIKNSGSEPLEFLVIGVAKDMNSKETLMATPPRRPR